MTKTPEKKATVVSEMELRSAIISLRSDGILHYYMKEYAEFTIDDAKELVEATKKLSGGKKLPMLTSIGNFVSSDNEAKKYMSKKENNKYVSANAVITKNIGYKIGINVFVKFFKPDIPTRLFTSEEEAVLWLKKFIR